ncbi:MAG: APC family permease [Gammaproteobacteria bacterium]
MSQTALRRDARIIGLLFSGVGGIIGSGWLFGPLHAAQQAGSMAVWSWVVGGSAVLLLALVYSELVTLFPKSGALIHISHVSHGAMVGRIWSWALFLAYVTTPPVEVMAILSYANNYLPGYVHPHTGLLTIKGFIASLILLGVVVVLNFLTIRWVLMINNAATWWKLFVPAATVVVLLSLSYHPENLHAASASVSPDGVFTAVATAGVIFSFLGFRQAIDLGGETSNPSRDLPLAVIGSVLIATVIYIALQYAFLLSINPADIGKGGWPALHFEGMTGPLAAIAAALGAGWWATVLYADAIISPAGTGFIYTTTASRITMAMGEMGSGPRVLSWINVHGVPWVALVVTYLAGAVFFFPFPSWQKLVAYISSVTVLSYGIGPVVMLVLRRKVPNAHRPFRLRGGWIIAPGAFIASNWIIFWAGFKTVDFLFGLMLALFIVYLFYYHFVRKGRLADFGWSYTWWLVPYFGGLWMLTRLGPAAVQGNGALGFGSDMLIIAVFSLAVLWLALHTALPDREINNYIDEIRGQPDETPEAMSAP